jgi:hypothetical protein
MSKSSAMPKTRAVDPNVKKPFPEDVALKFTPSKQLQGNGLDATAARREVGGQIQQMVDADEMAKGRLVEYWEQIDARYLGRMSEVVPPPWEGAPQFNLQTMRNKTDQAVAFTSLPLSKANPYFLFRAGGPDGNNVAGVESIVHYFLKRSTYGLKMNQSLNLTFRRGKCPVKVEYFDRASSNGKPFIRLMPTDALYFRIYPNSAQTFEEAILVGEVIQVTLDWIEKRQRSGDFFADHKYCGGYERVRSNADAGNDKQTGGTNAVYSGHEPVDLFVGMMAADWDESGEDSWREVIATVDDGVLLFEQKWEGSAFPYVDLFVHDEEGRYYNESCMCGLLTDTHDWINYTSDMQGWLSLYVAAPPIFGTGSGLPDEVVQTYPGMFMGIEDGGQVFKGGGEVNLGAFPQQLALARQVADETSRVSQNGMGANLKSRTSATEASQIAQGQATGIESYQFLGFSYGLEKLAETVQKLLAENYDDWYPVYKNVVPDCSQEELDSEYWIEVNGQTPVNSPAALMAQATQLLTQWNAAVQAQPDLPSKAPDMVLELIRSTVEASTLPSKHKIMPSREEMKRREMEQERLRNEWADSLSGMADFLEADNQANGGGGEAGGGPVGVGAATNGKPGRALPSKGVDNIVPGSNIEPQ